MTDKNPDKIFNEVIDKKPTNNRVIENIVAEIKEKKLNKLEILDLGSGGGYNAWKIKKDLPGLDIKITCVDMDKNGFFLPDKQDIIYIDSNLNENFSFGKFDFVIATEVVEHLENPYQFMRNCFQSTKDTCTLFLTTPNVINIFSIIKILFTGRPYLFGDMDKYGHKMPFFPLMLERFILIEENESNTKYKTETFYNKNIIRLYPFRKTFKIFGNHSRLFGESVIFKITKN